MARTNESTNSQEPALPDQQGWRHWGDGLAGKLFGARLQGFYPTAADYRDVQVDVNGVVQVSSSGSTGGGAATIADGADIAQGTTTDLAWTSGAGTVISLLKKIASAGGSAVSIADGADVAQGTTTDASTANTVVGILKAIKAAVTGTLTVATHAVTQSGTWTVARSWALSSATDSVNVGNFPATQAVSLATAPTTPVTGTFFQATQPVSGTVTANQGGAPWSENISQVGGVAVAATAKGAQATNAVPTQTANNANATTYTVGATLLP